jgi:hypothetical protein
MLSDKKKKEKRKKSIDGKLKKSSDDVGDFDVSDGFIFSSDRIGA